jgi:Spy/CpxP family protein refolding chaperone
MTRTKIALYIALIFLAGGITGAGIRSMWKQPQPPRPPMPGPDFAKQIFNRINERLQLTPEQIEKIEPVFRKGIDEVRAIQDRSVKEVEAAVKRNHEELASLLTPEQVQKLQEWDREREKWRKGRRHNGPGQSAGGAPAGQKDLQKEGSKIYK